MIDLRSKEKYQTAHIPSSIIIPLANFHRKKESIEGFILTPKTFQALLEKHGILNSDEVSLYSD